MKQWVIIDDETKSKSAIYETKLNTSDKEEALQLAKHEWTHKTRAEMEKCDSFYIAFTDIDEDGCIDYNSMTNTIVVKDKDGFRFPFLY